MTRRFFIIFPVKRVKEEMVKKFAASTMRIDGYKITEFNEEGTWKTDA